MPSTSDLNEVARRELTVFYVLDTSGSMTGAPISTLNRAMEETIEVLKDQKNSDAKLKIAVLEFNSGCKWVQPAGPEEMEDFFWEDLEAGGLTDVGAALNELDDKLSTKAFLDSMTGAYMPIIIFMTDGYATDDYTKALDEIRKNKWFKRATKIGFAIGDDPDLKMICEVVGNSEAVVRTNDLELFAKLLRFASVTASMLVSKSRTSEEEITGAKIIQQFGPEGEDVKIDTKVDYNPEPDVVPDQLDDGWPELEGWD